MLGAVGLTVVLVHWTASKFFNWPSNYTLVETSTHICAVLKGDLTSVCRIDQTG